MDSFGELGVFRIPGSGTGLAPPLPPAQMISAKIGPMEKSQVENFAWTV